MNDLLPDELVRSLLEEWGARYQRVRALNLVNQDDEAIIAAKFALVLTVEEEFSPRSPYYKELFKEVRKRL